ncbi:MAG TPA: lipoprotein insertase outer membrane protein LolB [Burkholderiales bacterium]|jgi:outer membrane lipoprotein LolB|nr:lipoprotein insertase outer membrane protein LolB [Burkholderiales bacterium]
MRRAWLLLALLLGACVQAPTRPPGADALFDVSGRLAARYAEESFTGGFSWRHAASSDQMLITSPLGQGVARIEREGGSVVLTTAEPHEYRASDAEALTEQVLGFRLPLAGLADWVRGAPSPSSPAREEKDEQGRLKTLEQAGWRIEYQDYSGARPSRMRLTYPGIELRLAIAQWN